MPKTKQPYLPTLTPSREKTKTRDYAIFVAFQTGTKIPELMKEYKLGKAMIYRILRQRNDESTEWTSSLPIKTTEAMHEIIAREAWAEIAELREERQGALKQGELALAMGATDKLIGHLIKYDTLLINGITLSRIKKTTKEVKRVIDTGRIK